MSDPLAHWLETPFGKVVQKHINCGFKVFPIQGIIEKTIPADTGTPAFLREKPLPEYHCTCGTYPCKENNKNAGKHPYAKTAPNGFKNATGDIAAAAEMFEYRTDLNVGIATGAASGIIVIDVDNKNENRGDESLRKLQDALGQLPATMKFITGNGYHLLFDYPKDAGIKTNSFGKDNYPDIDVKTDGGYIVVPPSRHFTGRYYHEEDKPVKTFADLPENFITLLKAEHHRKGKEYTGPIDRNHRYDYQSEWSDEDIQGMLDAISELADDYHRWVDVGFALHSEGKPFSMWEDWSGNSPKFSENPSGLMWNKWRGFNAEKGITIGTVVMWATERGWRPKPKTDRAPDDGFCDELVAKIKGKTSAKVIDISSGQPSITLVEPRKKEDIKFDFNSLEIKGKLGDTIRWIVSSAIYEQPELALLNVLAFAGAVFGRKYCSLKNTRTNIYLVGIAGTARGKDHSRKMIQNLATEADLLTYLGGNAIRSDTGMLRDLERNASMLMMLDEFGMLMQHLGAQTAQTHQKAIGKALMSLYSDSNSTYNHGAYADAKNKPIIVVNPNLCIYGTSTETSYVKALRKDAIDSGELNRFIVIPGRAKIKARHQDFDMTVDLDLTEWWGQFSPKMGKNLGEIMNNAIGVPVPKVVEWGECQERQKALLDYQDERCQNELDPFHSLWGRFYENTLKIAIIFAIARDPESPVLIAEDLDYGESITRCSIVFMEHLAKDGMAENPYEAAYQEIVKFIKEKGGKVSRRDLLRKFRKFKEKEMTELLSAMVNQEVVLADKIVNSGRPTIMYSIVM